MKTLATSAVGGVALSIAAFLILATPILAQNTASAPADVVDSVRNLQDQVRELRSLVEQMRTENQESRAEMQRLRQDLQSTRALLEHPSASSDSNAVATASDTQPATGTTAAAADSLEGRVEKLEESTSLIGSKVDEYYQTKVETASRYRARVHGIVLMNAFRNVGGSDDLDFPNYSQALWSVFPKASLGATMRQSEIGLEIFGPTIAGAHTSADLQLDFSGGIPAVGNGINFGVMRLQTANMRLDWEKTSIVAGQDALFLSPLSPTSYASLATPTFGFAGNLWAWTPQIRVEHRFSLADQQNFIVQGGVFDNLDWEPPLNSFYRTAQAGELSGQPAYGARMAWTRGSADHPLSFGAAGYYGRQNWVWNRYTDAWAGMVDWQIPLLPRLGLSGEFYRGRGIGGLGAAVGASIVYGGPPSYQFSPIRGLNAAGGWAQLKFKLTPKIEFNGVFAQDNAYSSDVRGFATDENNFGEILGRNRGTLANIVYRPKSDLILSGEVRRLRTFPFYNASSTTNQVNLSAGVLF